MSEDYTVTAILVGILVFLAIVLAYFRGAIRGIQVFQRRLVMEGHAEYYLDDNNEWQWRIKSK